MSPWDCSTVSYVMGCFPCAISQNFQRQQEMHRALRKERLFAKKRKTGLEGTRLGRNRTSCIFIRYHRSSELGVISNLVHSELGKGYQAHLPIIQENCKITQFPPSSLSGFSLRSFPLSVVTLHMQSLKLC